MELCIKGLKITPKPGQTLLELLRILELDRENLSEKPIAAKIAGEVFNLNYIPLRQKDTTPERTSIRRAMAASKGNVHLLTCSEPSGRDVYGRTVQFVLALAMRQLWPDVRAKMNCTVGPAIFVQVSNPQDFSLQLLKQKIAELICQNIPLIRRRITTQEAKDYFLESGQKDKARLLSWREKTYFDVYTYEGFAAYYYGELAPSTGYMQVWDIIPADGGFLLLYPDDNNPNIVASYQTLPKLFSVSRECEHWRGLMECETIADLNDLVQNGKIRELIRVNEALHEKRFSQIADKVCTQNAKVVMLAGPSSSGKTTSANRLATQLRVHGKKPILLSLDDYYMDRDKIPVEPDGTQDLEHINTIDTDLFRKQIGELLSGGEIQIPSFNFLTGKREWNGHFLQLSEDSVIIAEGLHALNPVLLPEIVSPELIFKLYVCPLLPLNLDDHNWIPASYLRLLRRIVRDYETRGASVQKTISMWDSVRRGEKRWIFPFQENADQIFNSATLYELAVLKKHIYPLLTAVEPEDSAYEQVRAIVKILNYVLEADVDDELPPTSIVREFIGGNSYYRK